MTVSDELLQANETYVAGFDRAGLPMPPSSQVAVVACMDARLDVYRILGLELGQAHVIRTPAGSSATTPSARWSSPSACSAPRRSC